MRTVYRANFQLSDQPDPKPSLEAVSLLVIEWASSRRGIRIQPGTDLSANQAATNVGVRSEIETRYYEGAIGTAWGLRLTTPDEEPDVVWVTETTVHRRPDHTIWISCSLQVGRQGEYLTPVVRFPSRPGVVERILSKFAGKGILPLTSKPIGCTPENVPLLLQLLESPSRRHPVVFVSTTSEGEVLADGVKLADHLAGLAYVIVAQEEAVSEQLGMTLSDRLNCFHGGVRLYWPGFSRRSSPYDHPLWIRSKIVALTEHHPARLGSEILNRIASVSVFTSSSSFVPWSRLSEWQRASAIEQAKMENNQGELLTLFEDTNRDLEAQVQQLRMALEERAQDAAKYRNLAATYRLALESGDRTEAEETLETSIDSVAEALAAAAREYPDRLAFCWNSKSEDEQSPFEDPAAVLAALRWLATEYFDARNGTKLCSDLPKAFRENVTGWSYEPHQSKLTMNHRKHRDWYHANHNGREISLPGHLRYTSNTDARHSVRIAFAWDVETKKIVLGYLGQHQQNAAS
ncbi:MAG: hypothetical protein JWO82_1233 [Akkermansiaceae bacterium]|nr:hypothetical protein [Akkermansiaceae bacterium]